MDPEPQNKQKDPNLIQHPNGSVDDVDAAGAAGAPQRPSVIAALARDLGIEGDLIKDVGKELVKGFVKEKLGISGRSKNTSKFGRTVDTIKSLWWVPAAVYLSLMLGVLLIKFLSRMMEI